jgi:hypothetical protein
VSETVSGHTYTDIHALWDRCARIEARQREYGMHDPDCPARLVEKMNANGYGPHYVAQPCTCWLAS